MLNKYNAIIEKLEEKGVSFESGMSQKDILETEEYYSISFPVEMKEFFISGLPVSSGFYNWRNTSSMNTSLIRSALKMPIEGLLSDFRNGDLWCEKWGLKPERDEDAIEILLARFKRAPEMIPIYAHRYMPSIPGCDNVPVFSIMQSDIIYYGTDLISYLEIEFGLKQYNDILQASFRQIEFWSDLM